MGARLLVSLVIVVAVHTGDCDWIVFWSVTFTVPTSCNLGKRVVTRFWFAGEQCLYIYRWSQMYNLFVTLAIVSAHYLPK